MPTLAEVELAETILDPLPAESFRGMTVDDLTNHVRDIIASHLGNDGTEVDIVVPRDWIGAESPNGHRCAVDRQRGIDRFCSRSEWILPFHLAFRPAREIHVYRRGDSWLALAADQRHRDRAQQHTRYRQQRDR